MKITDEIWDIIEGYTLNVVFNCNDFFSYASADALEVCTVDFEWIFPIIEKYKNDGLNASLAYIKGLDPIKERINKKYLLAKKEIEKLDPIVFSDLRRYSSEELSKEG